MLLFISRNLDFGENLFPIAYGGIITPTTGLSSPRLSNYSKKPMSQEKIPKCHRRDSKMSQERLQKCHRRCHSVLWR
jgi:hypothetical protein